MRSSSFAACSALALFAVSLARAQVPAPDCLAPAAQAEPGTPQWLQRDLTNMACAEQMLPDTVLNAILVGEIPYPLRDSHREPARHDGKRFRYTATSIRNRNGAELAVDIFRPCASGDCPDLPTTLQRHDGPYPAVVVVHGGASNRQLHWWATQSLAEAGYMTVAFDVAENSGGDHGVDAQDIVDWLFSPGFPYAAELRRGRVGIAGHSQGASTASLLGQIDPRLSAIVAWDNLTALRSGWEDDIGVEPPADVVLGKPALGIGADYYFVPTPNPLPPEPAPYNGEGGRGRGFTPHPKDLGYQELRAAGVDAMLFVLRAGTHLDFTPTSTSPSSRYGQAVSNYLTLAWFDRYLKGADDPAVAADAFRRLHEALVFDGSVDVHSIGTGPLNADLAIQPVHIEGLSICDRMSFYYTSRYAIRAPGSGRIVESEDWRSECLKRQQAPAPAPGDPSSGGGSMPLLATWLLLAFSAMRRASVRAAASTAH